MHCRRERARLRPGPLVALTLLWLALTAPRLRAHDPGLSALDVSVSGGAISAALSFSSADVAVMSPNAHADMRETLRALARDAVHLSLGEERLSVATDDVVIEDGGARIQLAYVRSQASLGARSLTVASDVPRRLPRGHRELLVVSVDGHVTVERVLDAGGDAVTVDLAAVSSAAPFAKASSFLVLGIRHILSGVDHLVFLAGVMLAAYTFRELLVALTAFTAAHSVSLALVVVGGLHAPPSIVEPLIAASIAWVGIENLLRDRHATRWWLVFGFGLIHGFGFAGALVELGFGTSAWDVAVALLSFNAGVETGQLAAAAIMLPIVCLMRSRREWSKRLVPVCSLMVAIAGGCWLIARLW